MIPVEEREIGRLNRMDGPPTFPRDGPFAGLEQREPQISWLSVVLEENNFWLAALGADQTVQMFLGCVFCHSTDGPRACSFDSLMWQLGQY